MAGLELDGATQRLDKWLWFARFCKSRSIAAELCRSGRVRLNRQAIDKPHQKVRLRDVLTFPQGQAVRVIEVRGLGARRGPAAAAQALYADLNPPPARLAEESAPPAGGGERPTKRQRRQLDRWQGTGG